MVAVAADGRGSSLSWLVLRHATVEELHGSTSTCSDVSFVCHQQHRDAPVVEGFDQF